MFRSSMLCVAALLICVGALAAETKPDTKPEAKAADATKPAAGQAEAKVDKALAAPAKGPRIWVDLDYYGLFDLDAKRPGFPLATAQPRTGSTNPDKPGFFYYGELSSPDVLVRYDKSEDDYEWAHGFKGAIGGWINAERKWGAELNGFVNTEVKSADVISHGGSPFPGYNSFFSVPFYNAQMGYEDAIYMGFGLDGANTAILESHQEITSSQKLWGIGASGYRKIVRGDHLKLDGVFGFRNLNLQEDFAIDYYSDFWFGDSANLPTFLRGGVVTVGETTARDRVEASNHFYGANLGVRFSYEISRFVLDVRPQVAFGVMDETVDVSGSSRIVNGGVTTFTDHQGIFARNGSIGETSKARFAVIPEIAVKFGVKISKNVQFKVGYDLLYISDVVRAGNQLSRSLNAPRNAGGRLVGPVTGVAKPFETDDFMAHGVTGGFTIKF